MIKQTGASLAGHFVVTLPIAVAQKYGAISEPHGLVMKYSNHQILVSSQATNPQAKK